MFDMLSSERRTARFMIWPARLAVSAETGTRTSARQVSRQFSQMAMPRQLMRPQRLADHLAQQGVEPLAERVHVVGEPRDQLGRALVAEARQVERHRPAVEVVADVEEGQLHDVGDEHFLEEQEEALDRDAQS